MWRCLTQRSSRPTWGMTMLECKTLSVRYGQHQALDKVSLSVDKGEIVVILGANGAGKTSLINAMAGRINCSGSSHVLLAGSPIQQLAANKIVEMGLALVPEGRGIFAELSVIENLTLGAYAKRARDSESRLLDEVFTLFPRLAERRQQQAGTMSGGEQQMVAIGRALMSRPEYLMLDEPSLGLSPLLCSELFQSLTSIRETGVGILLVEQNARQALSIAERGYLLENGRIIGDGTAHELLHDEAVRAAYLGGAAGSTKAVKEVIEHGTHHQTQTNKISPTTCRSDELLGGIRIKDLVTRAEQISRKGETYRSAPLNDTSIMQRKVKPHNINIEAILERIEQRAATAREQKLKRG